MIWTVRSYGRTRHPGEGKGALADHPSRGAGGLQEETERMSYQALFSAASRSIHDLNAQAPAGLYAALEPGKLPPLKGPASTSDAALFRKYRERGQTSSTGKTTIRPSIGLKRLNGSLQGIRRRCSTQGSAVYTLVRGVRDWSISRGS